ncbi:hypothetical protein ACFSDD_00665 [Salipiger marinus]|uniref:hypothetical protein n=1 Tax=Salipiger marinus TaxID=555512 RepID=UPI001E6215C3|nr:hypothetical protein [Salipiger manganoxidans]MCD1620506.1 hypothetical protein [Salipiger manganoxidans]MEB3421426.1 hypothetical protein [Salipiger manganoxidans]
MAQMMITWFLLWERATPPVRLNALRRDGIFAEVDAPSSLTPIIAIVPVALALALTVRRQFEIAR